jgi:hypothetical protein
MLAVLVASPAAAQFVNDARHKIDLDPDPLGRTPRLLGMGRLTYTVEDFHNRIDLWELEGYTSQLIDADTSSSFELTPGTNSGSTLHDDPSGSTRTRQDLALRQLVVGYEAWRRASDRTAYGLTGDFSSIQSDVPQSLTSEERTTYTVPRALIALSGKLQFLMPDRFRYGMYLSHRHESRDDDLRAIVTNGAGEFIDQNGAPLSSPNIFTPNRTTVGSIGGGGAASMKLAPWGTLAARADYISNSLHGENNGARYATELREERPFTTLGAALTGLVLGAKYMAAYESWSGTSEQTWVASISAGSGATPLAGRGTYANRDENGSQFDGRLLWTKGPWSVGGGIRSGSRDVKITPPAPGIESFNSFLAMLPSNPGADTLSIPDSVVANKYQQKTMDAGGGLSRSFGWHDALVAAEFNTSHSDFDQDLAGEGPKRKGWGARAGGEFSATPALRVRAGYLYESLDQDELTKSNEFITQGATAGFGYQPPGSGWIMEIGYGLYWSSSDFGDPTRIRSNRHQGLVRVRWSL